MKTIIFEFEVITPMFLAGADGATPELRPASIKGAMRFWWRAIHGHLDINSLKRDESEIFGDTGKKSKVILNIDYNNSLINYSSKPFPSVTSHQSYLNQNRAKPRPTSFKVNPLDYLAFGIEQYDKDSKSNILTRDYIDVGSKIIVMIRTNSELIEQTKIAFKALEQFGGLGSKARNGFGCFKIVKATENDKEIILNKIEISSFTNMNLANFSAFSSSTSFKSYSKHKYWSDALAELGKVYQQARENIENWHSFSIRELIAAPIIVKGQGQVSSLDRHAKPFFFNVSRLNDNHFQGSILCMPYNYIDNHRITEYNSAISKMKTLMNF